MNFIVKTYLKVREEMAQGMTEYALIMAAVAVVSFAAYQALGGNVKTLVNSVSADL